MKKKLAIVGILMIIMEVICFSMGGILRKDVIAATSEKTDVESGTWDVSANDGKSHVTATLENGVFTVSGNGAMKNYNTYNENKEEAPWKSNKKIKEIKIEKGVTHIGNSAFEDCRNVAKVTIADTVTRIGNYAFYLTSIKEIQIPNSVTSIGHSSFATCLKLETLYIPANVKEIEYQAFTECRALKELVLEEGITIIGDGAFAETGIKELILPNSIEKIEKGAFSGSALRKVVLPNTLQHIPEDCFLACYGLEEIEIPESVKSIESGAFNSCVNLLSMKIPNDEMAIGYKAFAGMNGLNELAIPPVVKPILGYESHFDSSRLNIPVHFNGKEEIEVEMPDILKRAKSTGDSLYSEEAFSIERCSISEDGTKVIIKKKDMEELKYADIEVKSGILENFKIRFYIPVVEIEIASLPDKVVYKVGNFSSDIGLSILEKYEDGTEKIVTPYGENAGADRIWIEENTIELGQDHLTIYFRENGVVKRLQFPITVVETLGDYSVSYINNKRYVEGIEKDTNVSSIKNTLKDKGDIQIYKNGTEITQDAIKLGTGMEIRVTKDGTEVSYEVVIIGDLNGDGEIGDIDLLKLARYKAGLDKSLTGSYLRASDVYKDAEFAEDKDLLKLARVLVGLDTL